MSGVNIGDLCTTSPWNAKRVLKKLEHCRQNNMFDCKTVKFFHCDPSKVVPIATNKDIKRIYVHLSNDEMCTTRSWKQWINRNLKPVVSRVKGKEVHLVVGNEVLAPHNKERYAPKLLPALRGCFKALKELGLDRVKVVTPLDTSCLECSYPPSKSKFKSSLIPILKEIFKFTVNARSKLCFNIYPFFARQHTSENFALFGPEKGYTDKGKKYTDLFSAQYDSVLHAISKLPVRNANRLPLVVTETGWPSSGEPGANPRNTRRYLDGIVKVSRQGTPMRPGPKEILVFELYDENLKHGPSFEKYFGVFEENGREKC